MPIITISRGSFSGGQAVAQQLSRELGCPCLSREDVLRQAAQDYGIGHEELTAALNISPPFWMQVLGKRLAYVECVTAALLDHARKGDLVYHGCVGHLLLAGISHVLRVRIIADMETRIAAAMERAHLSRDAAVAHIHRVDKQRSRWARLLYGLNWEDAGHYDVVINLTRVTVAGACQTLVRMAQLEQFQPTAESRQRIEDLSLSCRVRAAMARDPSTRSAGIQVSAADGHVLITGTAGSARAADLIPQMAYQAEGVKTVQSEVGVGADWYW